MIQKGYSAYIYPPVSIPKRDFSFKAYVFDRNQIQSILIEADNIGYLPQSPKAKLIYPAVLRILCCCGLRSSEVLMLKRSDVDLNTGILYIRKSKNDASRYVPVSESLRIYLSEYIQKMMFQPKDIWMFPSPRGGYLSAVALSDMCKKLFECAGIQVLATGRYPRVHDFRHSHIIHALDHMINEVGMDIYTALPIISAYVGHSTIRDTEYYIHLSSFHYEQITSAGEEILAHFRGGHVL
jgi:integrase